MDAIESQKLREMFDLETLSFMAFRMPDYASFLKPHSDS